MTFERRASGTQGQLLPKLLCLPSDISSPFKDLDFSRILIILIYLSTSVLDIRHSQLSFSEIVVVI